MILSAHDTGRKALLEAMSGGAVTIVRQPDGLIVLTVSGETFKGEDVNDLLLRAALFVTRVPEPEET